MILTRRFLPYFITQCLGALNDNVYKNMLLLLVTYSQVGSLPIDVNLFVNLAAGLFILPFFLFSAHAGLIADNIDKAILIRRLKLLEVIIMCCGAAAIVSQSYLLMLVLLFLMGTQSAFFGPVKYSLLPMVLKDIELVRGNAWVEMGTFISILIGTIVAGLIVASDNATTLAAITVVILASVGYISSRFIPSIPLIIKPKKLRFTPFSGSIESLKKVRRTPSIWMAVLAISWFWFIGATYLTQFPNFAKLHLHAGATVVSLLLALFSIGIAAGSFLCDRMSFKQVELGLLPFGLLGLTIFGIDLYWSVPSLNPVDVYTAGSFIGESSHYRLMFDLFMVGASGGLFIVPLYAFIQARTKEGECAQAIAANNIMNALFMVMSAAFAIIFLGPLGGSILQLFLVLAVSNIVVGALLFINLPELRLRLVTYLLARFIHPLSVTQGDTLPKRGGAILIGSSDSAKELFLIQSLSVRPICFILNQPLGTGFLAKLLRTSGNILELASGKQEKADEETQEYIERITKALHNEELVYLSPKEYLELSEILEALIEPILKLSISLKPLAPSGDTSADNMAPSRRVGVVLTQRANIPLEND
ncbi:Major Facilitator Superfamily transporter [Shewanella psychrophila]|uniref:Major Facilitator Superfamily transporter n=1 Tax=Shewanella psychrophila TaxID=225848 RepID=A0A1S6HY81_9GAMM|nr:MFS transporter [Shewanella psychrophila]AQS40505.1 Major Facilitator Superfamily transporter [Shewanella psychrophila]